MSQEALRDTMARMATDFEFRKAVCAGNGSARGLDLTPQELETLQSLSFDDTSGGGPSDLAPRLSKSGILTGGLLTGAHHDGGTPHAETGHAGHASAPGHGESASGVTAVSAQAATHAPADNPAADPGPMPWGPMHDGGGQADGGQDGGASAAAQDEQHHAAAVATPWSPGHGPAGPDVPSSDGPSSPGQGPDGIGGLNLPHHGSQGSGSATPFRTGGSSGERTLPTGNGGDDTPPSDVSVHHDDHHFQSDGRAGKAPDKPAGDDSTGVQHPDVTTSWSQGDGDSKTVHDNSDGTSHVVTYHGADHSTDIVDHYSGAGGLWTHVAHDGTVKNSLDMGWGSPHHDGGPDGGTEGSGPAVDPTWASHQHGAPTGDPDTSHEHVEPVLDPAAASKVHTGGSDTGGEGGTDSTTPGLKPGEASTEHIVDNPTGNGTASYGKVDPNPVG